MVVSIHFIENKVEKEMYCSIEISTLHCSFPASVQCSDGMSPSKEKGEGWWGGVKVDRGLTGPHFFIFM